MHLDGARLWNAHIASGVPLSRIAAVADTVSVALSKGLGAPVGSVLAGSEAAITAARRFKHAFGGGFRQAGILAAAGLYAIEHHLAALADDHRRAQALASAIAALPCWDVQRPETNLVIARVAPPHTTAESLCAPLRDAGVLCYPNVAREVRFALHRGLSDADVDAVAQTILAVLG